MSPRTEKDRFRPNLIFLSLAIPFDIPSIDSIDNYIRIVGLFDTNYRTSDVNTPVRQE